MARDESAAERSLRELQEQAEARSEAAERESRPSSRPASTPSSRSSGPGPTGSPTTPARRGTVLAAGGIAAVVALGVVAFLVVRAVTAGPEFARSFAEADSVQEARGREAVAVVESVDPPAEWTASAEGPEISMNGEDGGYAFYDLYFVVPDDYTGEDLRAWFEEQETVTSSDSENVTCQIGDAGQEVSCVLRFPNDNPDGTVEDGATRQTLTASFSAAAAADEGAVNLQGYSTTY